MMHAKCHLVPVDSVYRYVDFVDVDLRLQVLHFPFKFSTISHITRLCSGLQHTVTGTVKA